LSTLHTSASWSLLSYRVRDTECQQRVLEAFQRIAWPGITVLGTADADGIYVIVDCESSVLERHARRILLRVDPTAVRVLRSAVSHQEAAPS